MRYNHKSGKVDPKRSLRTGWKAALLLIPLSLLGGVTTQVRAELSSNATVFATGLDYPRGLEFGPDGNLYVAEAGRGGPNSSANFNCPQDEFVVPSPEVTPPVSLGSAPRVSEPHLPRDFPLPKATLAFRVSAWACRTSCSSGRRFMPCLQEEGAPTAIPVCLPGFSE